MILCYGGHLEFHPFCPWSRLSAQVFYLPRGVLPGSRGKMRGHLIAHRTLPPQPTAYTHYSNTDISSPQINFWNFSCGQLFWCRTHSDILLANCYSFQELWHTTNVPIDYLLECGTQKSSRPTRWGQVARFVTLKAKPACVSVVNCF